MLESASRGVSPVSLILILTFIASLLIAGYKIYLLLRKKPPPEPITFTLLTANVGNASIRRVLEGFRLENEDIPVLKKNISSIDPDIVFLQEVAHQEQVGMLFEPGRYLTHFDNGTCTAVRELLFKTLEHKKGHHQRWGYSGYSAALEDGSAHISLLNVHTTAPLKDSTFKRRGLQIQSIIQKAVFLHRKGMNLIIAGDFNFDPYRFESFRHRIMESDDLTELDITKSLWFKTFESSLRKRLKVVTSDSFTWHLVFQFSIDHVISNIECTSAVVLDSEDNRVDIVHNKISRGRREKFMDHRAVLCEFTISKKAKVFSRIKLFGLTLRKPRFSNI